jgi:hypothetical protein
MSHKDPVTGCIVADIFEVITPDEFANVAVEMYEDDRLEEEDIKKHPYIFYKILRLDGEDFCINIVKVHEIHSVSIHTRFDGMKSEIIATVTAYDTDLHLTKKGKIRYTSSYWSGTRIDQPDFDHEISWL